MLAEVPRFHRAARALLEAEATEAADPTWGEFLAAGAFSELLRPALRPPLVACVWSSGDVDAAGYPARHLFRFLDHHGMLSAHGSPTWRTVTGGSATYVDRLAARLPDVRRSCAVTAVIRHDDGVDVRTADDHAETFDRVVVATHADQALRLLADATRGREGGPRRHHLLGQRGLAAPGLLGAARSTSRSGVVELPSRLCPPVDDEPAGGVAVSYWMNRLHGFDDADDHVVTLNPHGRVDPGTVTARMTYAHPVFTHEAVAAATRLRGAGGERLAFAGAHLGWGFHEDGCRSGVEAAESFGVTLVTRVVAPPLPALVIGTVSHTRRTPLRHGFTHHQFQWLVDVDQLPALALAGFGGWLASTLPTTSTGPGSAAASGATWTGSSPGAACISTMPTECSCSRTPGSLGHVFDPLTVFWCLTPDGELRAVVLEVHNTYGERHAYLLDVDATGRAHIDKAFYVSPFNDVSGRYDVRLLLTPDRVSVTVGLDRDGERVLTATTTGTAGARDVPHPGQHHCPAAADDPSGQPADPLARHPALAAPPARAPSTVPRRSGECPMTAIAQPVCLRRPLLRPLCLRATVARLVMESVARAGAGRRPHARRQPARPRRRRDRTGDRPVLEIVRPQALFERLAHHPKIGIGEAYMAGDWRAGKGTDLAELLLPFAERVTSLRAACARTSPPGRRPPDPEDPAQLGHRLPREHRGPLRPRQRPVRGVPRREPQLQLRPFRRRPPVVGADA